MNQTIAQTLYAETVRLTERTRQSARSASKALTILLPFIVLIAGPQVSHAITAPATGTFGYDLYDVAVNDMIKGPVGFVGGMIAVVISAINITKSWLLAGGGILGGTALIKADSITSSMGVIV